MSGEKKGDRGAFIQGAATIIGALIGAVATLVAARSGAIPTQILPMPIQTITVMTTATSTVTASPSSSAPSSSTGALYLSDLPAISDLETGSRSLGGVVFAHSLYNSLSGCSERGPGEWVVPANVTAFTAQVGVEIDAAEEDSRVTFVVTAGGSEVYKKTFDVGDSEPIRVPVIPNTRMKLESIIDRSRRGNCNTEAVAVWGDAAFR